MPDTALLALTWRVTRRKMFSSPLALAAGLAFPAFVAWTGLTDSYGTAALFFFFLLPHVYLVAAQDAVRTDMDSGVLENVLFVGGRFRGFLAAKGAVMAAAATGYAVALFGLFAVCGAACGGFEPDFVPRFGLSVLAGIYYVTLAGVLSHWLRSGSSVVAMLLAQSAALGLLISSATSRPGLIDFAAAGHFPGLRPKLLFGALVATPAERGRLRGYRATTLTEMYVKVNDSGASTGVNFGLYGSGPITYAAGTGVAMGGGAGVLPQTGVGTETTVAQLIALLLAIVGLVLLVGTPWCVTRVRRAHQRWW